MNMQQVILVITTTTTALIAGLLYAYSCSVNPGLAKVNNEVYIASMQSINREIQNPLFFASFMGTLILLPLSTWLQYKAGPSAACYLLLISSLVYIGGVFAVTMFGNLPLNAALDQFNLATASPESIAHCRMQFEIPWNSLHRVRTVAALVSLVLIIIACIQQPSRIDS